jgi:hypothetical protein
MTEELKEQVEQLQKVVELQQQQLRVAQKNRDDVGRIIFFIVCIIAVLFGCWLVASSGGF